MMKNTIFLLLTLGVVLVAGCERRDFQKKIAIDSGQAQMLTARVAQLQGTVIDLGKAGIEQHGYCFSAKSSFPGFSDTVFTLGEKNTVGNFSVLVRELKLATTYYFRAFGIGASDTVFGQVSSFTTPEELFETQTIAGGTFSMGDSSESSVAAPHTVTLSDFKIGKYEITSLQFAGFLNEYGSTSVVSGEYQGESLFLESASYLFFDQGAWQVESGYEQHPASGVSWFGANEFCSYYGGRLPTEAEWEFAARGGSQSQGFIYSGNNNASLVAWFEDNSGDTSHAVGSKTANELGLSDMSGNLWEWCSDWYGVNYYSQSPENDPQGPSSGVGRVVRGGCFFTPASYLRVNIRNASNPDTENRGIGFRFASDL